MTDPRTAGEPARIDILERDGAPAQAPVDDRPDPRLAAASDTPLWFIRFLIVACAAVLGFGGVGLLAADIGEYSIGRVMPAGILGVLVGIATAVRYRREGVVASVSDRWAAGGMCVVAIASMVGNGYYAAHHVDVNRDPGVYVSAAKWLANHGSLVAQGSPVWRTSGLPVTTVSPGTYPEAGDTLQFQFSHMLSVLLAEADGVGGDGLMFRVPAVLGALALCVIYAVGRRIVNRPWMVLAAVTGLGISLPQVQVARDSFSETASQFLLWSGMLFLLCALDRRTVRGRLLLALASGAALGGTLMTHIDAPAFLIFLPLLAVIGWLSCESERRRGFLLVVAMVVLGGVLPAVLGVLDVQRRAGRYYHDLHAEVFSLYKAWLAVAVVSILLLVLWPVAQRAREAVVGHRTAIGNAAAWITAATFLFGWALRPSWLVTHGSTVNGLVAGIQGQEGTPVDGTRTYSEQSMVWMSWYLGPVTVALAVLGLALIVRAMFVAPSASVVVVLGLAGALGAGYLYQISISPDQLWATRRFVTVTMPVLAIAAAAAAAALVELLPAMWRRVPLAEAALGALAVGVIAFPLGTTWPLRAMSPQAGFPGALNRVCDTIGPHASVLFASTSIPNTTLVQSTTNWCGAEVAQLTGPISRAQLSNLARTWQAQGRTLWVLGWNPGDITGRVPGLRPALVVNVASPSDPQLTLSRPPSTYAALIFVVYGQRITS